MHGRRAAARTSSSTSEVGAGHVGAVSKEVFVQGYVVDPGLVLLAFNVLAVWPLARICRRAGFAPWWAFLIFVPLIGVLLVTGMLTFRRWPSLPPRPPKARKARRTA
jgi:hypothetical protein